MTTVIKIGGAVLDDPAALDILATAWKDRSNRKQRWVLVHGGGPQLDAAISGLGQVTRKVHGLRVTTPEAADVVRKTLDLVGAELCARLRERGVLTAHVPASQHRFSASVKVLPDGADLGRVGTVAHFDAPAVAALVPPGHLAVVTPVGWDPDGPLNINADEGALAVACAMSAQQLFLVTDVRAVRGADGADLARLDSDGARALIDSGVAAGGMEPKLLNSLAALDGGVGEVVIGDVACLTEASRGTRVVARSRAVPA